MRRRGGDSGPSPATAGDGQSQRLGPAAAYSAAWNIVNVLLPAPRRAVASDDARPGVPWPC